MTRSSPFAPRLRRMRRRILVGSMAVTALGLVALATMVTLVQRAARIDQETADLFVLTAAASGLLAQDEIGTVESLADAGGEHLFAVVDDGSVLVGALEPFTLDMLGPLVADLRSGGEMVEDRLPVDDGSALVVGRTFEDPAAGVEGQVFAWILIGDIPRAGPPLTALTWGASALLLVALGATTILVVDRTLRPASFALVQQGRFIDDAGRALHRPLDEIRALLEQSLVAIKPQGGVRQSITAVDHAVSVVDDLLTLFRLDALGASGHPIDKRRLRLDLLVESEVPDAATFSSAGPSEVIGDEMLIRRSVAHMIENALAHGDKPVEVTVVGRAVTVLDRGPGFGGDAQQFFHRFRSGGPSGGMGLGLALVAAVARVHNGSAYAENRLEGGAKVILGIGE